jgi:hypothetical protein
MSTVRNASTPAEAERFIEPRRAIIFCAESQPIEMAVGKGKGLLDEAAPDPGSTAIGPDVDVAQPPDSSMFEVGIDGKTADPYPSVLHFCCPWYRA